MNKFIYFYFVLFCISFLFVKCTDENPQLNFTPPENKCLCYIYSPKSDCQYRILDELNCCPYVPGQHKCNCNCPEVCFSTLIAHFVDTGNGGFGKDLKMRAFTNGRPADQCVVLSEDGYITIYVNYEIYVPCEKIEDIAVQSDSMILHNAPLINSVNMDIKLFEDRVFRSEIIAEFENYKDGGTLPIIDSTDYISFCEKDTLGVWNTKCAAIIKAKIKFKPLFSNLGATSSQYHLVFEVTDHDKNFHQSQIAQKSHIDHNESFDQSQAAKQNHKTTSLTSTLDSLIYTTKLCFATAPLKLDYYECIENSSGHDKDHVHIQKIPRICSLYDVIQTGSSSGTIGLGN